MVALGVNVAGVDAYLSFVSGDHVMDVGPQRIASPKGLTPEEAAVALRDDMKKVLSMNDVAVVRVLNPEAQYRAAYVSVIDRCALETIILLAASELGLDAARISRPNVRSILGLPRAGAIHTHAKTVIESVGAYWAPNKRDAAALAALAGLKA